MIRALTCGEAPVGWAWGKVGYGVTFFSWALGLLSYLGVSSVNYRLPWGCLPWLGCLRSLVSVFLSMTFLSWVGIRCDQSGKLLGWSGGGGLSLKAYGSPTLVYKGLHLSQEVSYPEARVPECEGSKPLFGVGWFVWSKSLSRRGCSGGLPQKARSVWWWLCVPEVEALRSPRTIEGVTVFSRVEASELFGRGICSVF